MLFTLGGKRQERAADLLVTDNVPVERAFT